MTTMPGSGAAERPLASMILPVLNDAGIIASTRSLLQQDTAGFDQDIVVVDAMSFDNSREIVARIASEGPNVPLLSNERRKTPPFNLGLQRGTREYVAILGAHNVYDRNYLRVCLSELQARGRLDAPDGR